MNNFEINIIGAGFAGCEAAWQLAQMGFQVFLYEKKKLVKNEIQKLETFAELVCSNTFRSTSTQNAVGILKEELKILNSFILDCAYKTQIPADDALAVDREKFSQLVDEKIKNHPKIKVIEKEFLDLENKELITIIATGPLLSMDFQEKLEKILGRQKLFYLDASSPIIEKNSIDFSKVYFQSRHKIDKSYICIPLNEVEFNDFHNELINAQKVELKDFEKEIFFKGCQPIEQLAKISKKLLLKSVMSPNHLFDQNGQIPYAVVQLRRDDAMDNLYNIVGFQTNLTWKEQARVFSKLPGLKNAIFRRFGVMHKNNFINSPKILNNKLQMTRSKNLFFAGQITGVEGYLESCATGLVVAYAPKAYLNNQKWIAFPENSVIGSLINYVTNPNIKKLKPMKANMGLMKANENLVFENKIAKNDFIYRRAIKSIQDFIQLNK